MKKRFIIILMFLIVAFFVNAADETGKGEKPIYRPNELFDLSIHLTNKTGDVLGANCNIGIRDSNYTKIVGDPMDDVGNGWYNYTYQRSGEGTFFCNQNCTQGTFFVADTCDFIIQEDPNNQYYLYIVSFLTLFVLLGLGYYIEDEVPLIIAGMLSIVIGINIFINGFPGLSNEFLKNGIIVVLEGIGFYYVLVPSVILIEIGRSSLGKVD